MTTEQQLPKGWKKTTFEDVAQVVSGGTPSTKLETNFAEKGKGIGWITPADLSKYTDKFISNGARDLSIDGYKSCSAKLLPAGTVLLSSRALIGYVAIAQSELSTNQGFKNFILSDDILSEYAYYYLKSIKSTIESLGSGTTFLELSASNAKKIPIIYPTSKETQQAIVNKIESLFDEIDEGIGRLKTAAQQIQQYRQSLLKNAFNGELTKEWRSKHADTLPSENELLPQIQTAREQHHAQQLTDWQNITIGEVVTISPKKEKAIDDDTDVSFSSMHLMSSSLSEHLTYEIKKWADVKKGFTVFRNNDVLLAKITPCFENGKSAVAQDLINGIGTGSTEFMVLRSSNQILSKFLYFLVNTPDFRQAGIHNMTGSVGHKRVPKDFVSTWAFSLPPLAEQTEIVAILESKLTACDQLADELAKQLKQAELLKQAVLKAAFSGSLLDK
ncbi:restriction endonuclease subunit S [Neisseria sp. LACPHL-SPEC-2024-00856]|uniref:restriction endonuclease subunit S n=1 Tax=Neisseria sp. LACPHL-SPEC-2024-00856 TaxID=3391057 RepID=UPI003A4E3EE7